MRILEGIRDKKLKKYFSFLLIVFFLCFGEVLRYFNVRNRWFVLLGTARSMIYIILILAWAISVWWRIVQKQVRRYLSGVAGLLLFWFSIRTIKYFFVTNMFWVRHLWYLYYVPITLIPLFALYVAICIEKAEDFAVGKREKLLYIPAVMLIVLIFTNDYHQWAFRFPSGEVWTDGNGIHSIVYFIDAVWAVVLSVAAIVLMFKKCRILQSRRRIWMPFIPLGIAILYTIVYVSGVHWLRVFVGDMVVVYSVLMISVFELCIQCRLIQSNTGYAELFRSCDIPVWIIDEEKGKLLESCLGEKIKIGVQQELEKENRIIDRRWALQRKTLTSMKKGYVVWAEDISEILELIEKLRSIQTRLIDEKALVEKEYKIAKRKAMVEEQKKLYLQMQEETRTQSKELEELLSSYEQLYCEEDKKSVLKRAALLEAYLRRRNILFLNKMQTQYFPIEEIEITFHDTKEVLEYYDIGFACNYFVEGTIQGEFIQKMHDCLEQVLEYSLESMTAVLISVTKKEKRFVFTISIDCKKDCFVFSSENVTVEQDEDGEWRIELQL